ncbi:uncharacterized protein LOC128230301 [Mya arenaria]|uniref:uncharacterized protein LOC128230301 n=1 Tax=Mya arenaria TaxID=6604 RepID=UPI0022E2F981|nr:uncharacterized protein LOC128230301 [Mya arenaria]
MYLIGQYNCDRSRSFTMKFVLYLLVLLPLAFCVEGSFMHEVYDPIEMLCSSGLLQLIRSEQASGSLTCEEVCNKAVASITVAPIVCPLACREIQSGSHHCP